jgi:hypothetical protein
MEALGIRRKATARWLGVDYAAGKRMPARTAAKRAKGLRARWPKLLGLKRKRIGIKTVFKQGFIPVAAYPAPCLGLKPREHEYMKTKFMASLPGVTTMRSRTLLLAVEGDDALPKAYLQPLWHWAKKLWIDKSRSTRATMLVAWRRQLATLGLLSTAEAWSRVKGPAGALIATLKSIGWACPAFDTLRDPRGTLYKLTEIGP